MRTSIRTRMLLAMNALVAAVGVAVGWAGIELAGHEIERRLVDDSVRRAAEVAAGMGLPMKDTLMGHLARLYGVEAAVGPQSKGTILGSSMSEGRTAQLAAQLAEHQPPPTVVIDGASYRVGSALVRQEEGARPLRLYFLVSEAQIRTAKQDVAWRIAWATLAAVAVATVLGFLVSATISRPLRKLAARMDAVAGGRAVGRPAGGGNKGEEGTEKREEREGTGRREDRHSSIFPLPSSSFLNGPVEVVKLRDSFDHLLCRLDEANARLEQSARLATLGQLSASVAHELRNPLSGIKMNARILADELAKASIRDKSLELIVREIDRMDLYLQELLSLAAGTGAPRPPKLGRVKLGDLAASVVALLEGRCRHAGVTIEQAFDDSLPPVRADGDQIRQVIMNLMLNAMDAMPRGGTMRLAAARGESGSVARFSVSDTGPGVQAPAGTDIFDPLVTTKSGGAGLGLYISRRIIAAHGGRIGYTTSATGCTFWFELPL
ncbi:MAG: nitrogen regulation protein NR(II) [Phycisphaerae bacterium]